MMKKVSRNEGTVTIFFAIAVSAMLTVVLLSVNVGKYLTEKKLTDNASEAIALSLATWEARFLNTASTLNRGTVDCLKFIRYLLFRGALAVGQATRGHVGPIVRFYRYGPTGIRKLWKQARRYSSLNKKLKKYYYPTLLECQLELTRYYGVHGISYPFLPDRKSGKRGRSGKLKLPLIESEPLMIFGDVREAIARARSKKPRNPFRRKLFKFAMRLFEAAVRRLFNLKGEVYLQVPPEDAPALGKIHYLCYSDRTTPFANEFFRSTYRTWNVAAATLKPGGVLRPTWKSRLVKPEKEKIEKLMNILRRKAK